MSNLKNALQSQVGRKVITGITGLGLVLFIIVHLLGNLTYFGGQEAINQYSHYLHETGFILNLARAGLLIFFLFHVYLGISIWLEKRNARPEGYEKFQTRGEPSKQTWSARSMIITGLVLLVFVVFHLNTFALGPYYTIEHGGVEMRDIYTLMSEVFQSEFYVIFYLAVMILLGMHLRHGVWSSFQSLGWTSPKTSPVIYGVAYVLGVIIAIGFIALPLYIYFFIQV